MTEYISREAAEQVLRGIANGLSVGETEALKVKDLKALYKIQGAKEILNFVDNNLCFIPAADVQPVKHGRWIWDSNAPHREHGAYKCSNCGCHSDFEENYCYSCGADMRGGENND